MNNIFQRQIVTIGIPIYKDSPTEFELFSFERCCKVLGKYSFSIITYEKLNIDVYTNKLEYYNIDYKKRYFDKTFFLDLNGYNRLMVSPSFYEAFPEFQYILIYQLDAFVFSDQLTQWCEKGYDYIGAPWLNIKEWCNKNAIDEKLPFFARNSFLFKLIKGKAGIVGNGGFSLRKIDSHVKFARIYSSFFLSLEFNEDIFWGKYVAAKERSFKIPQMLNALSFSVENNPTKAFKLLNNVLPFGCHDWYKNEINFWLKVFQKAGIKVPTFFLKNDE